MERKIHIEFHSKYSATFTTFTRQIKIDIRNMTNPDVLDLIDLKILKGDYRNSRFVAAYDGNEVLIYFKQKPNDKWQPLGQASLSSFLINGTTHNTNQGVFKVKIMDK